MVVTLIFQGALVDNVRKTGGHIGNNVFVAVSEVVVGDVPDNIIVGVIPAKILKSNE